MHDIRIVVLMNEGNMCKAVGEGRALETRESTTMKEAENKATPEIHQQ